jgi:2-oxo-3-hexenedioate decarboxylase/2-keto-4-pentenoate hydratase
VAAELITASRLTGGLLDQLGDGVAPDTERDAYQVQAIAHSLLESAGFGRRSGWKIGCTTKVMQTFLGIDSPCAGAMFLGSTWRGRHAFAVPARGRLGVECEIAVRIGRDLPDRGRPYDAAEAAGAVAASMAAIEVVQDRYADYPSLGTATLIADDFFHCACVLGPEVESFRPEGLRDVTGSMAINGKGMGNGVGADILGDPLRVLAWLANNCAGRGTPLQAGDVVLLGSLVQTQWVEAGDVVTVTNNPLGEVAAEFVVAL